MDWTTILNIIFPPVCAAIGWLAGSQKRKNDFLRDLQNSVNMLTDENARLLKELIAMRNENATLIANQDQMKIEIGVLRRENEGMKDKINELNERLAGVKTIRVGRS